MYCMAELNPKLEPGDRIILLHMDDPYRIPVGTKGTVVKISEAPSFMGSSDYHYSVSWDNGSNLYLEPDYDSWVLVKDTKSGKKITTESFGREIEALGKHKNILKHLDYKFIMEYLKKIRESGIVNMLGARSFLEIDQPNFFKLIYRLGGEPEDFIEIEEMVDEVRQKLIAETIRRLNEKNIEVTETSANREFERLTKDVMDFYVSIYGLYNSAFNK